MFGKMRYPMAWVQLEGRKSSRPARSPLQAEELGSRENRDPWRRAMAWALATWTERCCIS